MTNIRFLLLAAPLFFSAALGAFAAPRKSSLPKPLRYIG